MAMARALKAAGLKSAAAIREWARLRQAALDAGVALRQARRTTNKQLVEERLAAHDKAIDRYLAGPGGPERRELRQVVEWRREGRPSEV
jgi:hypothetical protein